MNLVLDVIYFSIMNLDKSMSSFIILEYVTSSTILVFYGIEGVGWDWEPPLFKILPLMLKMNNIKTQPACIALLFFAIWTQAKIRVES